MCDRAPTTDQKPPLSSVKSEKIKQKPPSGKTKTGVAINVDAISLKQNQPLITPEVERSVREFSRCTALYTMLVLSVGTMRDTGQLREDIHSIRQRGWELANHNKLLLVPRMRQANNEGNIDSAAYKNLERVFFMFCSCLEFFMEQLLRTVDLITSFQLNNGHPDGVNFVNSGLSDQMPSCLYLRAAASSISASPLSSPILSTARRHSAFNFRFNTPRLKQHQKQHALLGEKNQKVENPELQLKKDIKALKDLILEIHSSIAMTPWTIQPQYHLDRFAGNSDSLASLADSSDEGGLDSVRSSTCKFSQGIENLDKDSRINTKRRRCLILTIIALVTVFLIAIALGVCIRQLT